MESNDGHPCGGFECENQAKRRCSGCKKAWYCSAICQKQDWTFHIFDCNTKGSIRTAHYLARACRQDLMTTDQQTLEDFGFTRVYGAENESMLFGLYQGLFIIHKYKLEPRVLDTWRKEGTLVEHIKETFESIPASHRGQYYPWFLKNQWILDGSAAPGDQNPRALVERMERTLWDFLGPERKAQREHWSRERLACVALYRSILSDFHPAPYDAADVYIGFGFCVARDMYTEMSIARLYTSLIQRCTFEEFCDAYEASSLVTLMEAKGIIANRNSLPHHFELIMRSRLVHKSVWSLKHYIYGEGMIPLELSVTVDYGFCNCRQQTDEAQLLVAAYKVAFDREGFDEMELDEHCIQGKTLEYVSKFQTFSKKERKMFMRLMKNPYPLQDPDGPNDELTTLRKPRYIS